MGDGGGRGGTNMLQARHPPPPFSFFSTETFSLINCDEGEKQSVLAPGLLEDGITQ